MYTFLLYSILLITIFALAQCHTEIIRVNGGIVGLQTIRERSPIKDIEDPEMFCGLGPKPSSGPLSLKAGGTITLNYLNTGRAPEFLDPSHQGPCMAYIADAATPDKFSKIFEEGYNDKGVSCNSQISRTGTLSFNLPTNLKSGTYILRMELIALYEADGLPPARGAQFYIQCVDIKISGPANGVGVGANAVSIPGHVTQDTPGVQFNVYTGKKITNYPIPGPAVDMAFTIKNITLTHPKGTVIPLTTSTVFIPTSTISIPTSKTPIPTVTVFVPPSTVSVPSSTGGSSSSPHNANLPSVTANNFPFPYGSLSSVGISPTAFMIFGFVILALPLAALAVLFRR